MKTRSLLSIAVLLVACKKEKAETDDKSKPAAEKAPVAAQAAPSVKLESRGREHLPSGCAIAASIDWPQFRKMKSVGPVLDPELAKLKSENRPDLSPKDAESLKSFQEFLRKTQIDLETDPGELALCFFDIDPKATGTPKMLLSWGGRFVPGSAMEALTSFLEKLKGILRRLKNPGDKQSEAEIIEIGGQKVVFDRAEGFYFTQAKDGSYLAANDRVKFEEGLKVSEHHKAYALPVAPISLSAGSQIRGVLLDALQGTPFATMMATFERASFSVADEQVLVSVELQDETQLKALQMMVEALAKPNPALAADPLAMGLSGAKVKTSGKALLIDLSVPENVSRGWIAQATHGGPAAPPGPAPSPAPSPVPKSPGGKDPLKARD